MYYYVLESASSRAVRQNYQKLRDILTNLGIAGEMVTSSPARTPMELTNMGINKGYSTIVGVGSDDHINQVAATLRGRAVLGIVPIDASRQVTDLIGLDDLRGAAEALKHRRLTTQNLVLVEPDILLFLDATIEASNMAKANLIIDNKLRAHAYFQTIKITRDLTVEISSTHITQKKKFLGLFTVGEEALNSESHFHGKTVRIMTDPVLPVRIAGNAVAQTPIQLRLIPESLKVITRRGTILE